MARKARTFSETNIYHIVLKTVNAQMVFTENEDCEYFINSFYNSCNEYNTKILAYCIMSNHAHFLLQFSDNNIATLFKSFGAKYVPKFNYAHSRSGPLFNGRFYSNPVNTDEYLFAVLRYIHFNPVKAGICNTPEEYNWSSYNEYISYATKGFCDTSFVYSIIDESDFEELHSRNDEINEMTINRMIWDMTVDEVENYSMQLLKSHSVEETAQILRTAGITKNQISKVLNIDRRKL